MPIGLIGFPLGVLELCLIGVVIFLIVKAISEHKQAGKFIAAAVLICSFMVLVIAAVVVLSFVGYSQVSSHEVAQAEIIAERARQEALHIEAKAKAVEAEVNAKVNEINERIEAYVEPIPPVEVVTDQAQVSVSATPTPSVEVVTGEAGVSETQAIAVSAADPATEVGSAPGVTLAGNPWSDAVEEHQGFMADVYPSMDSAAEALGRQVAERLLEHVVNLPPPVPSDAPQIFVWMQSDLLEPAAQEGALLVTRKVLDTVALEIGQRLDNPSIVAVQRPVFFGSVVVRVGMDDIQFDGHHRWAEDTETGWGVMSAAVESPQVSFRSQLEVRQVPWVDNPARFASSYKGGQWLVAFSNGTDATQPEAHQAAIRAASGVLVDEAINRVNKMSPGDQNRFHQKRSSDPDWLLNRIADEIRSRDMLNDRFTQKFDRPYGMVWREAVLIDAEPGMMDSITHAIMGDLHRHVKSKRVTWFSYIGMGLLVLGAYYFLNMATKGYYAWSLRLATIVAAVLVVFLIRNVL